uniref:Immunoglobulin V-set domain-containing protein n=1 Tax=Salmo trutta TaxID=8032 RepID=A0A674BDL6_SALTR
LNFFCRGPYLSTTQTSISLSRWLLLLTVEVVAGQTDSIKADSLLWYRQYSGSGLQFLYLVTTINKPYELRADPQDFRLSVTQNKERTCVDLEISSAEVTDSAMYYCALRPTVTGNTDTLYKNLKSPESVFLLCM